MLDFFHENPLMVALQNSGLHHHRCHQASPHLLGVTQHHLHHCEHFHPSAQVRSHMHYSLGLFHLAQYKMSRLRVGQQRSKKTALQDLLQLQHALLSVRTCAMALADSRLQTDCSVHPNQSPRHPRIPPEHWADHCLSVRHEARTLICPQDHDKVRCVTTRKKGHNG